MIAASELEKSTPIDEFGCMAAATAFALNRSGITVTVEEIENVSGRSRGELPTNEGRIAVILYALECGATITDIQLPGTVEMRKYFIPGSPLTFTDFTQEMHEVYNGYYDEFYRTTYTQKEFERDMASRQIMDAVYDRYRATNQYRYQQKEINVELLGEITQTGVALGFCESVSSHEIAVFDCHQRSGKWALSYLEPDLPRSTVQSALIGNQYEDLETVLCPTLGLIAVSKQ